jgi:hypothetical protein
MTGVQDTHRLALTSSPEALLPEIGAMSEQRDPPLEEDSRAVDASGPADVACQTRLEALIQEQNGLLIRQIQLVEESCKNAENVMYPYKKPSDYLKKLDPCVRSIFADWHKEFCGKIDLYVTQSELSAKYQVMTKKGELMRPFLDEARKPWDWIQFYRSIAEPIDGVDPILPGGVTVGLADGDSELQDTLHSRQHPNVYDIDSAFAEMRHRHAWEVQKFVVAHQKVCLEKLTEAISLPNQLRILQGKLGEWAIEHSGFYHPQGKQDLESQAKNFVELVYRDEMPKAESKLKEEKMPSSMSITMIRSACMAAVSLAATTMSHELLTRLFAVLFALVCGMALLWEDLVTCSLQIVLGETVRRLRLLGAVPDRVRNHVLSTVNIPTIIWR